jgi:O-antigen biosynthesis protein
MTDHAAQVEARRRAVPHGPSVSTDPRPLLIRQIELSSAGPAVLMPHRQAGARYEAVQLLVRLHRRPLGIVNVPLSEHETDESQLNAYVWEQLGSRILEHLAADALPLPATLPLDARHRTAEAPCRHEVLLHSGNRVAVTVVVPTCDRATTLLPCLATILASSYAPLEVVVVENRPDRSRTAEALAAVYPGDERLRYIEEPRPGTSRARNRGLDAARGDVVAFVDDDVLVDRHWLAHLALAFAANPEASCVTGLILPVELKTPAQLWLEQFGGFSKGFSPLVFDRTRRLIDPLFPYTAGRFGSGANMALRTDVAREIGGFDIALGGGTPTTGGEDIDVFVRLMQYDRTLVYEPSAILWHRHPASVPELRNQLLHYGRGVGAVLTKQLVVGPRRGDFLSRIPAGVRYLFDPGSAKNARRQADYPRQLAVLELLGMVTGPAAYLSSRSRTRR